MPLLLHDLGELWITYWTSAKKRMFAQNERFIYFWLDSSILVLTVLMMMQTRKLWYGIRIFLPFSAQAYMYTFTYDKMDMRRHGIKGCIKTVW